MRSEILSEAGAHDGHPGREVGVRGCAEGFAADFEDFEEGFAAGDDGFERVAGVAARVGFAG